MLLNRPTHSHNLFFCSFLFYSSCRNFLLLSPPAALQPGHASEHLRCSMCTGPRRRVWAQPKEPCQPGAVQVLRLHARDGASDLGLHGSLPESSNYRQEACRLHLFRNSTLHMSLSDSEESYEDGGRERERENDTLCTVTGFWGEVLRLWL